jgi:hypothetical protein
VRCHFGRGDGATAYCGIVTKHANARVILVGGSLPKGVSDSTIAVLMKSVHLEQLYAALYAAAHPSASSARKLSHAPLLSPFFSLA